MKHLTMVTRTPVAKAQMTISEKVQLIVTLLSAIATLLPFFEDKEPITLR